jgi:flagellar FliL protein
MAATATAKPETASAEATKPRKGKKVKLLVLALVVLVVVGGAGGFLLLSGGDSNAEAKEPPKPEPGVALVLDPITVNLAGGRYLRLGMTVQLAKSKDDKTAEAPEGSRALDQAILLLTNASADSLHTPEQIETLKAELTKRISDVYDGKVMEVLLTQFVIQ